MLAFIDDIHLKNERSMRKTPFVNYRIKEDGRIVHSLKLECVNHIIRIVDLIRNESGDSDYEFSDYEKAFVNDDVARKKKRFAKFDGSSSSSKTFFIFPLCPSVTLKFKFYSNLDFKK